MPKASVVHSVSDEEPPSRLCYECGRRESRDQQHVSDEEPPSRLCYSSRSLPPILHPSVSDEEPPSRLCYPALRRGGAGRGTSRTKSLRAGFATTRAGSPTITSVTSRTKSLRAGFATRGRGGTAALPPSVSDEEPPSRLCYAVGLVASVGLRVVSDEEPPSRLCYCYVVVGVGEERALRRRGASEQALLLLLPSRERQPFHGHAPTVASTPRHHGNPAVYPPGARQHPP